MFLDGLIKAIQVLCFTLVAAFAGISLGWYYDDTLPAQILRAEINPSVIEPGDDLHIYYTANNVKWCDHRVTRYIIDPRGAHIFLEEYYTSNTEVGHVSERLVVKLPEGLEPGNYRYVARIHSKCNPLTTLDYESPHLNFSIKDTKK